MTLEDPGVGLGIVVVNFGSSDLIQENLVEVAEELHGAVVIVVDNFSGEPEVAAIEHLAAMHGWQLISNPRNAGFGGGVNPGVDRALALGCDDVLVLNPDAAIDASSVTALRRAAAEDRMALVAPVVRTKRGGIWSAGVDVVLADGTMRSWARRGEAAATPAEPWLSGACLLLTRELWNAVGPIDERYFLYWEDVDYSVRVRRAGGRLRVVEEATAVHDEGGTQGVGGSRAKSEAYYYFNIRNRMLFARLLLDDETVVRWERSNLRAARAILLRGGRRQFLRPIPPLRAAVRGLGDARRVARRNAPRHGPEAGG